MTDGICLLILLLLYYFRFRFQTQLQNIQILESNSEQTDFGKIFLQPKGSDEKILNWSQTQRDCKIEISFVTFEGKSYIAHKVIKGKYTQSTLDLDTTFKITFDSIETKIICKVILKKQKRQLDIGLGEMVFDLEHLTEKRKTEYFPFGNGKMLLEVAKYEERDDSVGQEQIAEQIKSQRNTKQERDHSEQEAFLQKRYNFLDKVTEKDILLKKDFSEKVYNLLKDIKYARAVETLRVKEADEEVNSRYSKIKRPSASQIDHSKNDENQQKRLEERIANLKIGQQRFGAKGNNINGKHAHDQIYDQIRGGNRMNEGYSSLLTGKEILNLVGKK